MSYQVLARKWRPQRFDDVIGQRGVTQTLRNAIANNRIAQSYVFSGPRGVGKTTTARILARGLSCVAGPTADPCGECEPCLEIAQGRDMDVIEIDAAANTQIDKIRAVIIDGLGVRPARNRYKIFIIDEVHRLSVQSFDALLKSVEEPPPHVVFMMATTDIDKVPPTIQSRSQVFELKLIGTGQIADQLRTIAGAEQIQIDDTALRLVARAGDGSMRDAQSAFDQVIAFAGTTITADDVTSVLGIVRRDMLLDIADAVASEDAAAVFSLTATAIETGYELRTVVRELARLTRDLLVVKIDPSRASDPEIAADAERERITALAMRFSQEDLMRAFEVFTKAEYEIKGSAHPRYHLEMALLRWIHMQKLVPLGELILGVEKGLRPGINAKIQTPNAKLQTPNAQLPTANSKLQTPNSQLPTSSSQLPASGKPAPRPVAATAAAVKAVEARRDLARPQAQSGPPAPVAGATTAVQPVAPAELKHAFLEELRKTKKFFYGTVVAQAQRIDIDGDKIVFVFAPQHKALRVQLDQNRPSLEELASQLGSRRMSVVSAEGTAIAAPKPGVKVVEPGPAVDRQADLKQQALADSGVQAMLDVFAAEIKDVEER